MKKFVVFLGVLALAACSQQQLKVAATIGCQVDGVVQPVAVQIAANSGNALAVSGAAADNLLLHPEVVAACKSVNGTPVTVISAPASTAGS